jgi:hypothetical protein
MHGCPEGTERTLDEKQPGRVWVVVSKNLCKR